MPGARAPGASRQRLTFSGTGCPNTSALAQTRLVHPWSLPASEKSGVLIHGMRRLLAQGVRIGRMASRRASASNAVATSASG